jgi:septal ring factor EnvC (AmiA/AmiB activator)
VCDGYHPKEPIEAFSRTPADGSAHARERWGSKYREPRKIRQPKGEREDDAHMSKVSKDRVLLGALVVLVLMAFTAGCGPDSDQGQAQQEATKNIEDKGQQARQTIKKKVEAKKQEVKEKVESLQKQVDDLQKEVQVLQKKINAQEQKEQQQQINQLKKALNKLKKKVEAREQRGQKQEK